MSPHVALFSVYFLAFTYMVQKHAGVALGWQITFIPEVIFPIREIEQPLNFAHDETRMSSVFVADSDAHSTTSSASPAQSPCYSNQSDDGSDTEMASSSNRTPVFSFLDLTYWKR